ncbi:potassium channel family protein [Rhodohalobacter sp. 8-1]|uniref:potassium channel family protein n=1 Tax=Rhodohalobacter sp. 8-1 TaxID=3131972 RepID=UPI0030EF21D4
MKELISKYWLNRILLTIVVVIAIILVYAEIFMWSMALIEGREVTFSQSMQVVVESLTTSGYGGFAPWSSNFMNYFVLLMNLTGVLLVFIAFPVFFLPMLRNAVEKSAPRSVSKKDHVIICGYSTHAEVLVKELNSREQEYVIIEADEDLALDLISSGYEMMVGDVESAEDLEAAGVEHAKAVVTQSEIDVTISIIFTIRNKYTSIKVIAIAEDENMEVYYRLAGADMIISPRQLVGKSLAIKVPAVSINDSVEIDNTIELVEIDIEEGSELCNKTVEEANLLDEYHVNIIGAWINGEFISPVSIDLVLDSKTRILVAGDKDELEKLTKIAEARARHFKRNKVLIFGYGQSGRAAVSLLNETTIDVKIVDIEEKEGVDIVGDVRVAETLEEAGIEETSAIIITVQEDTTAIFSTLMARSMNPDARIIVRANKIENVKKLYHAGADYVQSLATVSGRMLASCIFEDETSLAAEKQIDLVQLPAGNLVGQTLIQSDVRSETGCTILAVVRGDERITSLDPQKFEFKEGDEVIVAGTDASIHQFEKKYLN